MRRLPAALAVLAVLLVLAPPSEVEADAPEATAWWWSASEDALGLPASTSSPVEPGGLYVASQPTGPVGASALRLPVGEDEAVTNVVLVVDTDDQTKLPKVQGEPALYACPAARVWAPEEGGPLDRAPQCEPGAVAFGTLRDGQVRFPAGGLVRNGVLSIVIWPVQGTAFQVAFQKPGNEAVEVATYPRATDDGETPEGFEDYVGFDAAATFDVPSTPEFVGDLPPPAPPTALAPSAPADGQSQTIPESALPPSQRRVAAISRTPQVVAAMVVLGLILIYLGLLQAPGHTPQLLGPFRREAGRAAAVPPPSPAAADLPRGIGRFARPRTGPAPKL